MKQADEDFEVVMRVIVQMRLDLAATFEEGHETPVYFRTWNLFQDFVAKCHFQARAIRGVDPDSARYVAGGGPGTAYPYGMVWAKVSLKQKKVRKALVNTIVDNYKIPERVLRVIQADHLCNKKSVAHCPDGWLLIFPTLNEVNYRSGSSLEVGLRVDQDVDMIQLTPLHFFKLLSNFWPRNGDEFEKGMAIIEGQNMILGMGDKIRNYIGKRIDFPEIT